VSVLETAIRNALARSDRANAETRAKVYQSARTALNNGLLKQGIVDTAVISLQRERLETLINTIEAEEQEAVLAAEEAARRQQPPVPRQPEAAAMDVVPEILAANRDPDNWRAKEDPALMNAIPSRRDQKINFTVNVPENRTKLRRNPRLRKRMN